MGLASADLAAVVKRGAPVLLVDTCILFDLIRDVTRKDVQAYNLIAAAALLTTAENGNDLTVIVADQVSTELADNQRGVEEEARSGLTKFREQIKRINQVTMHFGAAAAIDTTHLADHVNRTLAVLQRWTQVGIAAPAGPDVERRAMRRVVQALAPSRKGKESAKDCLVVESYLEVAGELRSAGFIGRIVFASSNTDEYHDGSTKTLHAQLQADFGVHAIEYAPNFGAAKHSLGL
ncbi:PIN domain-containing protein [Limnohabitans sp.]|uniref:PIN domain-containing protein n=1 Tax=Limnohabitans sp. TaxID=1907725 RepID=UPI00289F1D27|nr:PIN domain-containing protein [Limnohabitans sp.]